MKTKFLRVIILLSVFLMLFIVVNSYGDWDWVLQSNDDSKYLLIYRDCSSCSYGTTNLNIPGLYWQGDCNKRCNEYHKVFDTLDELLSFCNKHIVKSVIVNWPTMEKEIYYQEGDFEALKIYKISEEIPIKLKIDTVKKQVEEDIVKNKEWMIE